MTIRISAAQIAKWSCILVGTVAAFLYFLAHVWKTEAWWARRVEIITKPIPVLSCMLLLALRHVSPHAVWYARWVVVGQVFSVLGDVLLLFPDETFLEGVICFLLGHVFYVMAFSSGRGVRLRLHLLRCLPFLAHFIGMMTVIWPYLGSFRYPALVYTLVIDFMAWRAAARVGVKGERVVSHVVGLLGVCLFIVSDSTLAIEKWITRVEGPFPIIMASYWAAQVLIAASTPKKTEAEEAADAKRAALRSAAAGKLD